MLLHKSNINVAIAVILSQKRSLYDLHEPKYRKSGKKGVARELFLGLIFVHPNFFDQWTLTDVNNITNLVDPADCTDFRPGTGLALNYIDYCFSVLV